MLCYSIGSRESYNKVFRFWLDHIDCNDYAKTKPVALVATKSDLRLSQDTNVSENMGFMLQSQINEKDP